MAELFTNYIEPSTKFYQKKIIKLYFFDNFKCQITSNWDKWYGIGFPKATKQIFFKDNLNFVNITYTKNIMHTFCKSGQHWLWK